MHADHSNAPRARYRTLLHVVAVIAGFTAFFSWLFARPILDGTYMVESDLYEYYLPIFLAPITRWSSFEFGGLPAFADPGDFTAYPPHFLFARLFGSWTGLLVSAFVLAACFTYAYVYSLTRSRAAAAFSGLAFGLSEAMVERLPHAGTLHAIAWLPLIVLAIDRIRETAAAKWIALGAVAVACCFLAGHPQPAIYIYYTAIAYAIAGGVATAAPRRTYLPLALMFVLGGALAAIKAVPFAEASLYMARQEVGLGQFLSHANSAPQMLSLLVPTILHEGREAPTYVGLITLALALATAAPWPRDWRVRFWAIVILFAWIMGMGGATPLPRLLFWVPLYGKFRAGSRHLFLAAFGLATLAGFAIAARGRGALPSRRAAAAAAVVLGAVAGAAALIVAAPQLFQFEARAPLPWPLPHWPSGISTQLAIAVATAILLGAASRTRQAGWLCIAMLLLAADALYSLPNKVTAAGLTPIVMPADAATPSIHARLIKRELEPLHQRALSPGGTHRDDVLPAAWARLWQTPLAGGYGPMLLTNQVALAQMGTNGSIRPAALASSDVSLDLLAVRDLIVKVEDIAAPPTFESDGITWSRPGLNLSIGRSECGARDARSLTVALPPGVDVAAIALVGHLRCSEDVAAGTSVLDVAIRSGEATPFTRTLRAGVEIAERELAQPSVAARAKHGPAVIFHDPDLAANDYVVHIRPPRPLAGDHLVFTAPSTVGWPTIDRLTVIDANGRSYPYAEPQMHLMEGERWVERRRFATSRISDRGADRAEPGESQYIVYENRRALPRAWVVSDVIPATDAAAIDAVRASQLPGGTVFDPRHTALVAAGEGVLARHFTAGASTAAVTRIDDGRISIDVTSGGGFLVLSEQNYPGWRAHIGGTALAIERTDLALQGVEVPPGHHLVEFEFAPLSLLVGKVISGAALVVALALLVAGSRPLATHSPGAIR